MSDTPNVEFVITELDPDLLSTPFATQTKWHVITGGPCYGKTTLIQLLAERGFRKVPEMARLYIEEEVARGRTRGGGVASAPGRSPGPRGAVR